jgi:hypothetical protein
VSLPFRPPSSLAIKAYVGEILRLVMKRFTCRTVQFVQSSRVSGPFRAETSFLANAVPASFPRGLERRSCFPRLWASMCLFRTETPPWIGYIRSIFGVCFLDDWDEYSRPGV